MTIYNKSSPNDEVDVCVEQHFDRRGLPLGEVKGRHLVSLHLANRPSRKTKHRDAERKRLLNAEVGELFASQIKTRPRAATTHKTSIYQYNPYEDEQHASVLQEYTPTPPPPSHPFRGVPAPTKNNQTQINDNVHC